MDQLIRLFGEKTPIQLLENYRQRVRSVTDNLLKQLFAITAHSGNLLLENIILSGSMAEGASLARLFSPDSKTARESEIDVMIPLLEWPTEESLTYVENNEAAVHIILDSEAVSAVRSLCGEEGVEKMCCQKDDGTYVSSQLIKSGFKQLTALAPIFNKFGFRHYNVCQECEEGSASAALQIDDDVIDKETEPSRSQPGDFPSAVSSLSRQAQSNADAVATHRRLTNEMMAYHKTFEIRITEMLANLETVQYEYMEMRKSGQSLHNQASKALEWALLCGDITDVIFDARQSTAVRYLHESTGMTIGMAEEATSRERIKQQLQFYIDGLAIPEGDVSDVSVIGAVSELLSDIENTAIVPARYLFVFRTFAKQQEMFVKVLALGDQNPQALQIAEPLQQFSGTVERRSIDFVPCLKLMFWPSVAAEWKTRDRMWPDHPVIESIANKCVHLVEKAFCHVDVDWRLSFSVAEIELATRWSPAQHFVYFIFKSLFYKFIKPLCTDDAAADISLRTSNKKYTTSYMAKTVMMWTSESFDQSWWTEADAGECLTVLLLSLQSAFQCSKLHHYFVSSLNLLEGLPDSLADRVRDKIDFILAEPAAIAGQLVNDFKKTEIFFNALPAQSELERNVSDFANMFSSFSSSPA